MKEGHRVPEVGKYITMKSYRTECGRRISRGGLTEWAVQSPEFCRGKNMV